MLVSTVQSGRDETSYTTLTQPAMTILTEEFVKNSTLTHNGKYTYEKTEYINSRTEVIITCPIHGDFLQKPCYHLGSKCGCSKCGVIARAKAAALTTEDFIERAKIAHPEVIYDYSKVIYTNSTTPVTIGCPTHGDFQQIPNTHLLGSGCNKCGGKIKLTTEEFITNSKRVHGEDAYDYSETVYINAKTPIKLICKIHGPFMQLPYNHTNGAKCFQCARDPIVTTERYVERCRVNHGDKYDYSKTVFTDIKSRVTITCKVHGDFNQTAARHMNGAGCKLCAAEQIGKSFRSSTEEFVTNAKEVHGYLYDYSLVEYETVHIPVKIICKKHGIFEQKPANHLRGAGCNTCRSSKGELAIFEILNKNNIKFIPQYILSEQHNTFRFDFYIPSIRVLIEFQGVQHYKAIDYFGGEKVLLETQNRDQLKRVLANTYRYKLLEIHYSVFKERTKEEFELYLLDELRLLNAQEFKLMLSLP